MRLHLGISVVLLCGSGCGGEEPSEAQRAADACAQFCEALPRTCQEAAQDVQQVEETTGVDCVTQCLQGDEPEGEMQPLPFLECLAAATSCDGLGDCKQQF